MLARNTVCDNTSYVNKTNWMNERHFSTQHRHNKKQQHHNVSTQTPQRIKMGSILMTKIKFKLACRVIFELQFVQNQRYWMLKLYFGDVRHLENEFEWTLNLDVRTWYYLFANQNNDAQFWWICSYWNDPINGKLEKMLFDVAYAKIS